MTPIERFRYFEELCNIRMKQLTEQLGKDKAGDE